MGNIFRTHEISGVGFPVAAQCNTAVWFTSTTFDDGGGAIFGNPLGSSSAGKKKATIVIKIADIRNEITKFHKIRHEET